MALPSQLIYMEFSGPFIIIVFFGSLIFVPLSVRDMGETKLYWFLLIIL